MRAILLLSYAVIFSLFGTPPVQAQVLAEQGKMTLSSSYSYEKQEAANRNYPSIECRSQSQSNFSQVIGRSVLGNAIRAFFWGHGKSYVYVVAAIHGNESNSGQLVERIRELLEQKFGRKSEKVTFIMIPCLNPDGRYWHCRTNANRVDLNRNFPSRDISDQIKLIIYNKSSLAPLQPEIQALLKLCTSYPPTLIYSIHQPYNLINYDGPAATIAQEIQRFNGMRIVPDIGYATPGSLGQYFSKLKKVPVITLELPYTGKCQDWEELLYLNAEAIIYSTLNWLSRHAK